MKYRVSVQSIHDTVKIIGLVRDNVFDLQKNFLEERYKQIHRKTLATTMVATGELRSKLFNRQKRTSSNHIHFSCGYGPTSNNQSIEQEFDTFGKVHHGVKEHYKRDGTAKCSRRPVDIYSRFGQNYMSNRSAKRRALAKAVESSLQTEVRFAVNTGHTMMYQPDLSNVVHKMRVITRAVTRLA
jgi:hypothetical protein